MLGSIDTFIISYFVTGKLVFAAWIASVETVTKVILFYGHERIWAAVPPGRADKVLQGRADRAGDGRPERRGRRLGQTACVRCGLSTDQIFSML